MKIGGIDITNPKIGTTTINKVFIGSDQVWPNIVNEFIFKINTALGDGLAEFTFSPDYAGAVNYTIDWGDSQTSTITTVTDPTHTYSTGGIYTIKINITSGIINYSFIDSPDKLKVTELNNWGTYSGLTSMNACFWTLTNIVLKPTDYPNFSNCTDFVNSFREVAWDSGTVFSNYSFSAATNIDLMFSSSPSSLNGITQADFSSVNIANRAFNGNSNFNEDFTGTNLAPTNMGQIFRLSTNFEGDGIKDIDISNTTDMYLAFATTSLTNQNYQDALIYWTGWNGTTATKTLQNNVPAHFGNAQFENGGQSEDVRNYLTGTLGWTITDGGGI